eukprot:TRINITY_DN4825_c0_g2_i1.p1 TRINITY_DN4825_c0_g2~~TRINITY_DN4825_c0_g2_i1.p1  ORF type:complete len:129 (+),score=12.39 TRINITY_DN4825_c0_g2_i1:771-1157(+)
MIWAFSKILYWYWDPIWLLGFAQQQVILVLAFGFKLIMRRMSMDNLDLFEELVLSLLDGKTYPSTRALSTILHLYHHCRGLKRKGKAIPNAISGTLSCCKLDVRSPEEREFYNTNVHIFYYTLPKAMS